VRRELPAGTVTFLFTDVEGSTKLLHELGAERYALMETRGCNGGQPLANAAAPKRLK
jgi:hypothetical protein